jgi:hypothetical protein
MFLFFILIIVVVLIIAVAVNLHNGKVAANSLESDSRLKGAKIFKQMIQTPMAITESGNIGISYPSTKIVKVFNIKDVNGFELNIDGKNVANIGGAITGGLLFGGVGALVGSSANKQKITKIELMFKLNDFNNPTVLVPLCGETKRGGMVHQQVEKEITELMNTLEFVEKNASGRQ